MGKLDGKVAFISGAARGQGRSHAVRLAEEGADIIGFDLCDQVQTAPYGMSSEADLADTARLVEATGRRIVTTAADVRDAAAVAKTLDEGVAELGRVDIVVANAGIFSPGNALTLTAQAWHDMIDINLTGVWNTIQPALNYLINQGDGGSIVITSSAAALKAPPNLVHYVAAKLGVVGIMKSLAKDLGKYSIRVNTIHPTNVNTAMIQNDALRSLFFPDRPTPPSVEEFAAAAQTRQLLPVPWVEPRDISDAVLFLVSNDGRYITGETLAVDAGVVKS
jgi:SDR family mycofactocin-dependent oxidoreductase